MSVTLITGASSGIGAELARQLAGAGHDLALCARRIDRLEQVRSEIATSHPARRVAVYELDVTDDEAVFTVFRAADAELGGLDRVVVNAGIGKGAPVGTGGYAANKATAMTNFVAALAQCEVAMEVFRARGRGHLVVISSIAAMRGLPKATATYAATKAGIAHLAEGLRLELAGRDDLDITVTTLYPGYIRSELTEGVEHTPLMTDTVSGVRSIVAAIEKGVAEARVPAWPWQPLGTFLRHAPRRIVRRMV